MKGKHLLKLLACSLVAFSSSSFAQTPVDLAPGTEVFVYQITNNEKSPLKLVANVSKAEGYDNQPSFSPDGNKVLFVSGRKGNQTDVYEFNLNTKQLTQLTDTKENEFSPMLEKGEKTFTAVREGGEPFQSVHRYKYLVNNKAVKKSEWAVKSQTPIGYYAFNKKGIAAGWARWANSIYLFDPKSPYATFVVGHALPSKPLLIPQTNHFSFVHRQADDTAWIKSLNPTNRSITPIAPLLESNIDYTWSADQTLISAKGSELYRWNKAKQEWIFWQNLKNDKLFNISRLAASSNGKYIAVVAMTTK